MAFWTDFRTEIRPTLRLALPLILAEIGWISMAIVDTMMVGRLPYSAEAIGAVSLASTLYLVFVFFGEGLLIGLDTLVSQAFGAGRREDCHHSLVQSVYLSLALTPFLLVPLWFADRIFRLFKVDPAVTQYAVPYIKTLALGLFPLLLYFAVRRTMQAMNIVRPIAFALISANLVNVVGNYVLIFGKWGFPAMGVPGSGWATSISRTYLALVLIGYLFSYDRGHRAELLNTPINIDLSRIRKLVWLGFPAAIQMTMEITVFALATTLIGSLGAVALASHQIAMNTVAFTYMIPLAISAAAAVRVGQALGRREASGAVRAGNTAILLGASFMFCMGIALLVIPRWIARIYTPDETIIRSTITLLAVAAAFQLFDGIQTVSTGALRGTGDTRTPMICHFTGYWLFGLPLGLWLCFRKGWGVVGLWIGLSAALIAIGILMLTFWRRKARKLLAEGG